MNGCRLALAQINPTVGALEANADLIIEAAHAARAGGADLVLFPELSLCGYPPEDLLLKQHFLRACEDELTRVAAELPHELVCLVGLPSRGPKKARNSVAILEDGVLAAQYHKQLLPNYGVFDEKRVFSPGEQSLCMHIRGIRLGLHICEDSWHPDAHALQTMSGIQLDALLNLSASPFHRGKLRDRENILRASATAVGAPLVYCNLIGGQDELVFDGGNMVLDASGDIVARAKRFESDLLFYDLKAGDGDLLQAEVPDAVSWVMLGDSDVRDSHPPQPLRLESRMDGMEEVYRALITGLRDYTEKNGFHDVLIAISGGIDSALVAALAVDALGAGRVKGISLPTRFSSEGTKSDATALATNLGIDMPMLPIQDLFEDYLDKLGPLWPRREPDVTEENLQARIRGNIVMALSNKFNRLVLATGNKSELATGYCTLYGDMCGGYAVIKDVPKTMVFALCRWINEQAGTERIPETTITRPPSAELRDDQKDSDSLPPYEVLDEILERYVEWDQGLAEIIDAGLDPETVHRVIRLVDINEYKRRQAAPGVKITPKAFGRDRRVPITNRFRPKRPPQESK